jgi:CcmD family protein
MYVKLLVAYGIAFGLILGYAAYLGRQLNRLERKIDRLD